MKLYFLAFFLFIINIQKVYSRKTSQYFHFWSSFASKNLELSRVLPSISFLEHKNISQIVATERAFAIRLAASDDESIQFLSDRQHVSRTEADLNHEIIQNDRMLAIYGVFGDQDFGGEVSGKQWELLKPSNPDAAEFSKDPPGRGHIIEANDVCALRDAFVALLHNEVVCWGSQKTCSGWDDFKGGLNSISVSKVYCVNRGYVAFPLLNHRHPKHKGFLSIFGNPDFGFHSMNKGFLDVAAEVEKQGILEVKANQDAVVLLFPGRILKAFGNKSRGGEISDPHLTVFVKKIVANNVGFAVLRETGSVVTWGSFTQQYVPNRVTNNYDDENSNKKVTVEDIVASDECFVALLSDGTVAMWGDGEDLYCSEYGAVSSDVYIPFKQVKDKLKKIVRVITTRDAFCAISSNGLVFTWGNKLNGGEITLGTPLTPISSGVSACRVLPMTARATCCAFCVICQDGSVAAWGNPEYGASLDPFYYQIVAAQVAATNHEFLVVDDKGGILLTAGDLIYGYWSYLNNPDGDPTRYLPEPVSYVFTTKYASFVLFRHDCILSEMSPWSACSTSCGPGKRFRETHMELSPINGFCKKQFHEEESCVGVDCLENPHSAVLSSISFSHVVIALFVVILSILFFIWVLHRCLTANRNSVEYL